MTHDKQCVTRYAKANESVTHDKPCVTRHAKENACGTHGKSCVHMHGTWNGYNWDGDQFVEWERNRKERKEKEKGKEGKKEKKEKRERRRRKGERKREKRKSAFRRSELVEPRSKVCIFEEGYSPRGRDSSYFGSFSTIRVVGLCLCPKGLFGRILKYGNTALF